MERTRYVHYARSKTPKVIVPARPRPKSACSFVESATDESEKKAPLAALEGDFQTLPRAGRRDKLRQNGPRSCSVGRQDSISSTDFLDSLLDQVAHQGDNASQSKEGQKTLVRRRHTMSTTSPSPRRSKTDEDNVVQDDGAQSPNADVASGESNETNAEWDQHTLPVGPVVTLPREQKPTRSTAVSRAASFHHSPSPRRYDWKNDPRRRPYMGQFSGDLITADASLTGSNKEAPSECVDEVSQFQRKNVQVPDVTETPRTTSPLLPSNDNLSTKINTSFEKESHDLKSDEPSGKTSASQHYVLLKSPHARKSAQFSTDSNTLIKGRDSLPSLVSKSKTDPKTIKCLNNNAITNVLVTSCLGLSKSESLTQHSNFAQPNKQNEKQRWRPKSEIGNDQQSPKLPLRHRSFSQNGSEVACNEQGTTDNRSGVLDISVSDSGYQKMHDQYANSSFQGSWKRNSLRRATFGYMSEFSFEDSQYDETSSKGDQQSDGYHSLVPDSISDATQEDNKNDRDTSNESFYGKDNVSYGTLERERRLNKIKRDSFKIATASFSDLTLLDIDIGDEKFFSCDNLESKENTPFYRDEKSDQIDKANTSYESTGGTLPSKTREQEEEEYLNKIKRNSMRLATSTSISDLTCLADAIDIETPSPALSASPVRTTQKSYTDSPVLSKPWGRTASLRSSKDNSSFGSFYSCRSMDFPSSKNSPGSTGSRKKGSDPCPSSPSVQGSITGRSKRSGHDSGLDQSSFGDTSIYYNTVNSSFQSTDDRFSDISTTHSIHRSNRWRQPAFYWTRPSPYVRPHSTTLPSPSLSNKVHDGKHPSHDVSGSDQNNCPHTHQRSSHKNLHLHSSNESQRSDASSCYSQGFAVERHQPKQPNLRPDHLDFSSRRKETPTSSNGQDQSYNNANITPEINRRLLTNNCRSEISPSRTSFTMDSPTLENMRSPPALGRPRRKQYAGFDSQPLPMDTYMSDSSSVYTGGVSCSSRDTDLTEPPDSGQFDQSFNSCDTASCVPGNDVDSSFEVLGRLVNSFYRRSDSPTSTLSRDNTRSSIHSTMTTHSDDVHTPCNEFSEFSDDEEEHSVVNDDTPTKDAVVNEEEERKSNQVKDFELDLDSLSRLYSFENVTSSLQDFSLGFKMDMPSVKAYSSSCLVQPRPHSRLKYPSSCDILDVLRPNERNSIAGCTSLVSLEKHANKVCRAILYCDEMQHALGRKPYQF